MYIYIYIYIVVQRHGVGCNLRRRTYRAETHQVVWRAAFAAGLHDQGSRKRIVCFTDTSSYRRTWPDHRQGSSSNFSIRAFRLKLFIRVFELVLLLILDKQFPVEQFEEGVRKTGQRRGKRDTQCSASYPLPRSL